MKEVKHVIFLACFLFVGIAIFLFYTYSSALDAANSDSADKNDNLRSGKTAVNVTEAPAATVGSITAGQASQQVQDSVTEEQSLLLAENNDGQYATSRGETNRSAVSTGKTGAQSQVQTPVETQPPEDTPAKAQPPADTPAKAQPPSVKPAAAETKTPKPQNAAVSKPATDSAETASKDSEDLDLLARLITAEAQGEPYKAQVAIGAVVLNRVKSSDWPDSIKAVIYQKIGGYYQFTPVVNGWIDKPAEAECIKAAKEALSGADPTNGAQFYYDDTTTNEWILAKPVSIQIGHMIFAF
jgi:spore germination cell wall hydrolase CwlJ-like protein